MTIINHLISAIIARKTLVTSAALRVEVRELLTMPTPGALTPHEQLADDQTPPPVSESVEKPASERRATDSALGFGDLLARLEQRQRH